MSANQSWAVVLASILAVVGGCKKSGEESATSGSSAEADGPLPVAEVKQALDAVPGEAGVVVTLAVREPFWDMLTGESYMPIPMDPSLRDEMRTALKSHVDRHIGLDVRKLRTVVVFGVIERPGADPEVAAVLRGVGGDLKQADSEHGGAKLLTLDAADDIVLGKRDDALIIGTGRAVRASLDVLAGEAEGLAAKNQELRAWIESQLDGAYLTVSASAASLPIPPGAPIVSDLELAGASLGSDGVRVALRGEEDALNMIAMQVQMGLQMGIKELEAEKEATRDELGEGLATIIGYYTLKNVAAVVEPEVEGRELVMEVPFESGSGPGTMVVVSMIGMGSAVAIPAFMKYIKKSKTAEARELLKKLQTGAVAYQVENGSLPPSAGPTPAVGSCCTTGEKCEPSAAQWETETWQALRFSVDDPHYYSYEFVNMGDRFEVRAYGDLDCDGLYSTFALSSTSSPLMRTDELE